MACECVGCPEHWVGNGKVGFRCEQKKRPRDRSVMIIGGIAGGYRKGRKVPALVAQRNRVKIWKLHQERYELRKTNKKTREDWRNR